jgi:hypothetical protein
MTVGAPIICTWQGDSFVPASERWAKVCDKQFVIGVNYVLTEHQLRSEKSHRHYFASVKEIWQSLPADVALYFPTADHLRKFALIRTGYHNSHSIVLKNEFDAIKAAGMMRPMNDLDLIVQDGRIVTRFSAKSQDTQHMGHDEFQKSKTDVLDFLSDTIGVRRAVLEKHSKELA